MTDTKQSAPRLEPDGDGMDSDEAQKASEGIVEVMHAVLETAVGTSGKPGWALAGVLLAARSMRLALPRETSLTEEDLSHTLDFVRTTFVGDAKESCIKVAQDVIRAHCTSAGVSNENLEAVVKEAAACVEGLQNSGNVEHPITMLVVLYAARQMVLALLKHQHPDEYKEMYAIARSMENSVRPRAVHVMEVPLTANFTKGGDA
jgi:hypothetical protein